MDTENLEKILLDKEIKPTANRILVARTLISARRPMSLADIEQSLDTIDKASIFRVLELFSRKDMVHVIEDGSRSLKYEFCHSTRPHSAEDQHIHFHCDSCRETFCFEDIKTPLLPMPDGFTVRAVNYVVKGLCPKCGEK